MARGQLVERGHAEQPHGAGDLVPQDAERAVDASRKGNNAHRSAQHRLYEVQNGNHIEDYVGVSTPGNLRFLQLELIQDGTRLTGQLSLVEEPTGVALSWDVVGGVAPGTHEVVLIGSGAPGRLLLGGPVTLPPDPTMPTTLSASFHLNFNAGGVDLGMLEAVSGPRPDDS